MATKKRRQKTRKPETAKQRRAAQRQHGEHAGIDWDAQPLGKLSARELAEKLGVSTSAVSRARRARGIDAMKPGRKPEPYVNTGSLRLRPLTRDWLERLAQRAEQPTMNLARMIVEDAHTAGWTLTKSATKREGKK
jgi:hypothetical protein